MIQTEKKTAEKEKDCNMISHEFAFPMLPSNGTHEPVVMKQEIPIQSTHLKYSSNVHSFLSRMHYGVYLEDLVQPGIQSTCPEAHVHSLIQNYNYYYRVAILLPLAVLPDHMVSHAFGKF